MRNWHNRRKLSGFDADRNLGVTITATLTGLTGGVAEIGSALNVTLNNLQGGEVLGAYSIEVNGSEVATAVPYTILAANDTQSIRIGRVVDGVTVWSASATIQYATPSPNATPSISGTTGLGDTLTFNGVGWTPSGAVALSRQWRRDGVDISGEVGSTYDLTAADSGADITCAQIGTNSGGTVEAVSNAITAQVFTAPAISAAPTISGTAEVGQTLTVTPGATTGNPSPSNTFVWKRSGVIISGETGTTLLLTATEQGHTITCEQTATNALGAATTSSAATATVIAQTDTTAPAITNEALGSQSGGVQPVNFDIDEDGTLFMILADAVQSGITAGQVIAGNLANDTAATGSDSGAVSSGSPTFNFNAPADLQGNYYIYFTVRDAASNAGAPVQLGPFEIDNVDPILSSPTATSTGETTMDWGVTSDEAGGTVFAAIRLATDAALTKSEIENGTGNAVATSSDASATADGTNAGSFTGLTAATAYVVDMFHRDDSTDQNESAVVSSTSTSTDAAASGPTVGANASTNPSGNGSSITVNMPTHVNGDRVFVMVIGEEGWMDNGSGPSGWTYHGSVEAYAASGRSEGFVFSYPVTSDNELGASQNFSVVLTNSKERAAIAWVVENYGSVGNETLGVDNAIFSATSAGTPTVGIAVDDLILSFWVLNGTQAITAPGGVTTIVNLQGNTVSALVAYEIAASAGTSTVRSASVSSAASWAVATAVVQ